MKKFWIRAGWDVFWTAWMSVIICRHAHWSIATAVILLLIRTVLTDALERLRKIAVE